MVILIPLQHGFTAKVSDEDEDLADLGWYASHSRSQRQFIYVQRTSKILPQKVRGGACLNGLILARMLGRPLRKEERTHFVDGDTLNCCRDNLRAITYSQSSHSSPEPLITNLSTGVRGVSYCPARHAKNPYYAKIVKDKINHYIGRFPTLEEAEEAYKEASIRLYGEHSPYWVKIAPAEGLTRGR